MSETKRPTRSPKQPRPKAGGRYIVTNPKLNKKPGGQRDEIECTLILDQQGQESDSVEKSGGKS